MQKKISFKNNKDQRLVGVLHIPQGKGPFPAVIVQHGLYAHYNYPLIKLIALKLAKAGFMVLRFSVTGHKPSSGTYKDILASRFVKDINSGINFLKKQPKVNRHRIGIVGHSLGAFCSLIVTSLNKDIKAVVSIASFTNVDKQIAILKKRGLYQEFDDYITVWGRKLSKNHYQDRKLYKVKRMVADIHCPLLIIHGAKDKTTNSADAREIFKIANDPRGVKIIKGADHNFKKHKYAKQVASLITAWFKKYLAFKEDRVVNALLECKGKILLLKRGNKVATHRGKWSPVGGYMEDGHTSLEQARKEVGEELRINPKVLDNYCLGKTLIIKEKSIDRVWRVYPVLFRLKKMPKVKLDWENVAYRWVKPLEIKKMKTVEFRIWNLLKEFKLINR